MTFVTWRLELYMLALKTVQKYKLEYHGPKVEIDWTGTFEWQSKVPDTLHLSRTKVRIC